MAWDGWLRQQGLEPGDRVGIFAENGPFFVAAYLGAIRAGLCAVPCPVDCCERTFERIVTTTGMKRLLVSARFQSRVKPHAERLGLPMDLESPELPYSGREQPPVQVDTHRHLAAIMLTSGSTGEVKGVMVTHHNILINTQDILSYTGIGPDDRVMTVLPFCYCYGTSLLHTHLMVGGALVINNHFLFLEKVLDEMESLQCTGLAGVPATYQLLIRRSTLMRRTFPALRWFQQAGGRLPSPLIRELRDTFPQVKLFVMYGQTEATARLSYLPPERLDDKLGSIGRGLPHTRLEVLHSDGAPVVPGSDEIGEIVASGENITLGYWNDEVETRRYFRHGKLHTGDMARVDADGFIYIVGRTREFIKSRGYRVAPKEIEDVLAELPEVVESAVIGVPDDLWGEAIHAYVVPVNNDHLTVDAVREHCLKRLPNYELPHHIEIVSQLPKTRSGKVDKERLRASPLLKASAQ